MGEHNKLFYMECDVCGSRVLRMHPLPPGQFMMICSKDCADWVLKHGYRDVANRHCDALEIRMAFVERMRNLQPAYWLNKVLN